MKCLPNGFGGVFSSLTTARNLMTLYGTVWCLGSFVWGLVCAFRLFVVFPSRIPSMYESLAGEIGSRITDYPGMRKKIIPTKVDHVRCPCCTPKFVRIVLLDHYASRSLQSSRAICNGIALTCTVSVCDIRGKGPGSQYVWHTHFSFL